MSPSTTMRLPLPDHWTRHLCGLPETAMGYQVVDVRLKDGTRVLAVKVFNAEEIDWPADRGPMKLEEIEDIQLAAG